MLILRPALTLLLLLLLAPNVMAKVEAPMPPQPSGAAEADNHQPQPARRQPSQPRGEMLYSNHCLSCHESVVHIREQRQVSNLSALRENVARWSQELELNWTAEEIDDVALYLNIRYYHYTE